MTTLMTGRESLEVRAPVDGRLLGTVANMDADAVREAARRGRAAQPGWQAVGWDRRAEILRSAAQWVMSHRDELVDRISSETGKTWEDAFVIEVGYAANALRFWARQAPRYLAAERVRSRNPFVLGRSFEVGYRPRQLVGVVGPWNFPLLNSFGDCVPALAAGCAVLLKPSEVTPMTSLLMARCMAEIGLSDDVFQVVTGNGGTGAAVVDEVDTVMFTGSTRTGQAVMERAARTLTPVSLELGGKDPMLVLADASLTRAIEAAVYFSTYNSGQACIATERIYVEAPLYDAFVEGLVAKVGSLRQGPPAGPGSVDVGAMTFEPQMSRLEEHVADAVQRGARVLCGGGRRPGLGRFFEPTVLVDVDHSMRVMQEESFGPLLPVMRCRDADHAVELANDSRYGLAASVFGGDVRRATGVARRVRSGVACVNDAQLHYIALEAPMGGVKGSGIGSRHGAQGIRKFCDQQTVMVNRFPLRRELQWPPYGRGSRLVAAAMRRTWG